MNTGKDKPDHKELIRIMDMFVAESIDMLLVGKVAKGFDAGQYRRLTACMKSVCIVVEDDR